MGKVKVLFVNDEFCNEELYSFKKNFESGFSNLQFDYVGSNQEMYEKAMNRKYDCIIYDLGTGGDTCNSGDGFKCLEKIQDVRQGTLFFAVSAFFRFHKDKDYGGGFFNEGFDVTSLSENLDGLLQKYGFNLKGK